MKTLREQSQVLIVDDDSAMSRLLGKIYQRAGYPVMSVNNPLEVMDILANSEPRLLTLDIDMPEKSGLELLAEIRKTGRFISVIVVSAHTSVANRVKAFSLGADYILAKPITDSSRLIEYSDRCVERMRDWIRDMSEIGRV